MRPVGSFCMGREEGRAARQSGGGALSYGDNTPTESGAVPPFLGGGNDEGTGKSADELLAHCLQDTLFPTGDLHLCHTETAGDLGLGFAAVVAQKDEAPIPFLQRG